MTPRNDGTWMKIPIEDTTLSAELKLLAKQNGLYTIQGILNIELTDMQDNHWLTDSFVEELGMLVEHYRGNV